MVEQSDEFGGMRDIRPIDGGGSRPESALHDETIEAMRAHAAALAAKAMAADAEMLNPGNEAIESEPTVQPDAMDEPQVQSGHGPSKLPSGSSCEICGSEQATIRINVDGNTLLMESCDGCDIRRWQLAGQRIDLQEALNQVGEHSGRRR